MSRDGKRFRIGRGAVVFVIVAAMVPAAAAIGSAVTNVTCGTVRAPQVHFAAPTFIDKARAGGEPVSQVAQDGSIVVSAHAGTTHLYKDPNAVPGSPDFVVGYFNQTLNWRSTDFGKTWTYVGLYGQAAGPHSVASTGFSDPDLTMDSSGRIYNTEIDLANDSVYSSPDNGQTFPYANPEAGSGDRPWLTGQDPNELYLYITTPTQLWRSTDGGTTFSLVSTSLPAQGKLLNDPLNPHDGLIGPDGDGITISKDQGQTWTEYPGHLGPSTQFFGDAIAADRAGWVYAAGAGGYTAAGDTTPDGSVTFNYFNRKTNQWAATPVSIPTPSGDALWPWMTAGDDGRAAVVWYQNTAAHPDQFFIYAAVTSNAHGTMVKCSDGTKKFVGPQFRVVNASGRPIHVGDICLDGTACNANTPFAAGDRRLGDFFTVNYDLTGRLFIASGDTTLTSVTGGPKPVGNPIFIGESKGFKLLAHPIPAKPPVPPCGFPCLPPTP